MFELLRIPRYFGVVPFGPVKGGLWAVRPILLAYNIAIILLLVWIHQCLLSYSVHGYKYGPITFVVDDVFIGVSCIVTFINLLWNAQTWCRLVNSVIVTRRQLPFSSKKHRGYSVTYHLVPFTLLCLSSAIFDAVEIELMWQNICFLVLSIYLAMPSLFFLGLIDEILNTLSVINGCILCFGFLKESYLRELKGKYLECLCEVQKISRDFSFVHFLKFSLALAQCAISVTYVSLSSPDEKPVMVACMMSWCTCFFYDILLTVYACRGPARKIHATAKCLERISSSTKSDSFLLEVETFSLLLHQIDVEFDAFGFFKLNFGVISSMVGTIVTYAIIIEQFR